MPKTIGNPLTWGAQALFGTAQIAGEAIDGIGGQEAAPPQVHRLAMSDIGTALRKGMADAMASRSDVIFIVLVYPLIGGLLAYMALHRGALHLVFPLTAGFALLGPVSGIALYDMSRRRESESDPGWGEVLSDMRTRLIGPELLLGLVLAALFVFWMLAANAIYAATLGPEAPASLASFVSDVLTTSAGWAMILAGCGVGLGFAAVALVISVVSFPMLVDRRVGLFGAVVTSARVAASNPGVVAAWGLIIAALLALGSIPAFLGLIVVLPVLGHASWHFYRAAVS
ncbi:MAG: DUF2189 domain-containing protein [Limimaricola sp.]|uniref:DUF2189 domain-containing protein n=1 Tax=Limimaricola sp. TaxID=2211665 RepID=UPI001D7C128D|nr:DUF2189 domain-containing protein [Limimaricola sp.]MBI1418760.1 DUF2189 domain-containing protein [Limimaricola sp.]